jgi:F-type H+-transporting ATPase subunit delta
MASVTSRYARAFVDVVLDRKLDPADVRQQIGALLEAIKISSDLRRLWASPAIAIEEKVRLLDALAARLGLCRETRNFAAVLIQHRRIGQLEQIARQFEQELNRRTGVAEAEVTSARELNTEERRVLESQIERMTGKTVVARYAQDRSLLGGAVVRMGSTIYDGSVRGQLEKIREELSAQ